MIQGWDVLVDGVVPERELVRDMLAEKGIDLAKLPGDFDEPTGLRAEIAEPLAAALRRACVENVRVVPQGKRPVRFGSKAEYERAFTKASRVEGYGMEVTQVVPCPGCCAPDYLRIRILHAHEDMQAVATCSECGLSTRSIVTPIGEHGTSIEMVLVGGGLPDDPWMPPMRTEEEARSDGEAGE